MKTTTKISFAILLIIVIVGILLIYRMTNKGSKPIGFAPAVYAYYVCVVDGVDGPVYAKTEIVDYYSAEAFDKDGYTLPVTYAFGQDKTPVKMMKGYSAEFESCKKISSEAYGDNVKVRRALYAVVNRTTGELLRYRYTESGGGASIEREMDLNGVVLFDRRVTRGQDGKAIETIEGNRPPADRNINYNYILNRDFPAWWKL